MPFKSLAQRRWAHTPAGTKALGGKANVAEWEASTTAKNLPEHVKGHKTGKQKAEALLLRGMKAINRQTQGK